MQPSPCPRILHTLNELLGTTFSGQLEELFNGAGATDLLRVQLNLCSPVGCGISEQYEKTGSVVCYIDLASGRQASKPELMPVLEREKEDSTTWSRQTLSSKNTVDASGTVGAQHADDESGNGNVQTKRRKVSVDVGLNLPVSVAAGTDAKQDEEPTKASAEGKRSIRQVHSDSRFPLRKPRQEPIVPVMTPTSTDKLLSGIWRQIHSEVKWGQPNIIVDPDTYIRGGMSKEAFRLVNTMCLTYHSQSQSSRALEMIVQAYWVDCYEARIVALQLEQPLLSGTEARMTVLREACAVLRLTEKELRNRLGIWRGYKEIKEAGGWPSLVFAGSGVYRFCKYRVGFNEGLIARLRQLRQSFEVAADTLHPQWRQLLGIVGQASSPRYTGHPHEWVIMDGHLAQPLKSTYRHLGVQLDYQFIDESVIDRDVFGERDPRQMPQVRPDICTTCAEQQSDNITLNRCSCFPDLFGCVRLPTAVQLVGTQNGKNNGVVARRDFERGAAIGEFVGLITTGIEGRDVMIGGSEANCYQIFQGQMGNFTRFINHSCNPNSQFQRFYWRGSERIVVVSRGVLSGSEITVDYSNHYWSYLDKSCLCGEPCCRFSGKRVGDSEG